MSKEKQIIEEIARTFCGSCDRCLHGHCTDWYNAEAVYNAGYRKQSELLIIPEMSDEDVQKTLAILKNQRPQIIADDKSEAWISVDERLPDIIDTFLVVIKMKYPWEETWEYNVDVAVYQPFEEGYIEHWDTWNDWDEGQECHITHWLPLPTPPFSVGGILK